MIELGTRQEVVINGLKFFVQHMDPFTALHTLGELQKIASPLIAEIAGVLEATVTNSDAGVMDKDVMDMAVLLPAVKGIFLSAHQYIDGDNLVNVLKLLLSSKFISVDYNGKKNELNDDMIRFVFNGDMVSMLELAYHVMRINYADFFTISTTRFGTLTSRVQV